MHHDSTVVTIYSHAERNPAREYDHHRENNFSSCRLVLPFDTEWALNFKFLSFGRRRLELRIDGALVTDSLILSGTCVLERFVESDRKFRFVRALNEGVSDPTNSANGVVLVRLWREYSEPLDGTKVVTLYQRAAGATVEGNKSNQSFGTTKWSGDAVSDPLVFQFHISGREIPQGATVNAFCHACGGRPQPNDLFCRACGTKL